MSLLDTSEDAIRLISEGLGNKMDEMLGYEQIDPELIKERRISNDLLFEKLNHIESRQKRMQGMLLFTTLVSAGALFISFVTVAIHFGGQ